MHRFDRQTFFDTLRPHVNLTTQNVAGLEKVLAYAEQRQTPIVDLAYIMPTGWWESAQTMHPVKEAYWLSEDWRRRNLRYWPYYGRGLIQTTWEDNYRALALLLGYPEDYFVDNPDLLLEWEFALPALFVGMEKGIYTGKSLDDYIDDIDEDDAEDLREFVNARRIVNGTDKAQTIGRLALTFEKALRASVRTVPQPDDPGPEPEEDDEIAPYSSHPDRKWLPIAIALGVAFLAGKFWKATKWLLGRVWAGIKGLYRYLRDFGE